MKKLLLICLMLIASVPLWAHDFEVDGIYYNITSETTVGVTYRGSYGHEYSNEYTGSVTIPSSVIYNGNTYSVTSIGLSAFSGCPGLTEVTIPNSVTTIGADAFFDCTGLIEVTIPNSVTFIDIQAFQFCRGLTSIIIPNSVTTIGDAAFRYCSKLTSITIPNSVTTIGDYAFSGCTGLTEVIIPNSVTTIGNEAFKGCYGLTKVTIPNSVITIGSYAFQSCSGLTEVTIPNSVTSIGDEAFSYCSGLTSVTIGNSVTSIGDFAFYACTRLTGITIPSSITSIGEGTFSNCFSFGYIVVESGNGVFDSRDNCNAVIETATNTLVNGCKNSVIPNSVTSIGDYAFYQCRDLTKVTIPNSVTLIGDAAFNGCSGLTKLILEDGEESITGLSFPNSPIETLYLGRNTSEEFVEGNYTLKELIIGKSVTSISNLVFSGCSGLTKLILEDCEESITGLSFPDSPIETLYLGRNTSEEFVKGKYTLKELIIGKSVTSIGNLVFNGCNRLTKLILEDGEESISGLSFPDSPIETLYLGRNTSDAFVKGKTTFKELVIGDSVTIIGSDAFSGCTGLTEVTIPSSVTTIGSSAFSGCNSLNIVNFNAENCKQMVSAESSVFSDCLNLKLINIGNSVKILPNNAFSGCTGLTEITIPNSVTSIGSDAFKGCTGLNDVNIEDLSAWCKIDFGNDSANPLSYSKKLNLNGTEITELVIPNDITEIKDYAFYDCTGLTEVTIPNSVASIGSDAFKGCTGLNDVNIEDLSAWCKIDFGNDSANPLSYSKKLNLNGTEITELVIPNDITEIKGYSFYNCAGLTSITIPNSVTSIGDGAFSRCCIITIVNSYNTTAPTGAPFENVVKQSAILNVPSSALASYQSTDGWKDFANICEMAINGYYDFDVDGIYYRIISLTDLTVEVVAKDDTYNSYTGDVVIPETVSYRNREFNVISIGAMAFSRSVGLTSITIPQTVTSIGNSAFNGCNGLTKLILEDGEESISGLSFPDSPIETLYWGRKTPVLFMQGNTTLKVLTIGKFITDIGYSAFSGCSGLTEVTIPNSVASIGSDAFKGCTGLNDVNIEDLSAWCKIDFGNDSANPLSYSKKLNLNGTEITELVIPNDITEIKGYSFYNCAGLTSITVPNSVTSIGNSAFNGCNGLTKLVLEDGTEQISGLSFPNSPIETLYLGRNTSDAFVKGKRTFKELVIGDSVTIIKDYMFKNCTDLRSIAMSNSVTEIGASAFNGCTSLTTIKIPESVTKIGESAFMNCSALTQVELLEGVTTIEPNTFNGCTSLITIKIPGSVATIEESAFMNCSALTQVELSEGVTTVGASAFNGCTSLTTIKIPGSVTTIGESAFMNCNALTQVELSEGVTTVGASAFNGCTSLASIAIPGSITTIGGSVFSGCTALVDVIFKNGKDAIDMGGNTFKENPLVSLYIGRTMTNVKSPFNGITTLEKVTLGSGMTSLQSDAFVGCKGIKELIIEGGEGAIAIDCKFNDSPIEKLHIGRNGTYAFNNRIDLKEVSVGDNVTILPNNAFNGCSNITTLKLGKKLEKIGSGAFTGCATLMNVYSTNLTPPTGAVFENKTYLQGTLYVVKGSKAAYEAADGWKEFWEIVDNLPFEVNGIWYNIDENGNANVVGNPSGDSYVGEFSIPASVEIGGVTYPVTSIDAEAFANALNVTSITIEDSNQPLTIGAPATAIVAMSNDQAGTFEACMLDSVYVGRNLNYATAPFANIASLEKVAVGALVTSMGGAMFDGCKNINAVHSLNTTPPADTQFDEEVYSNAVLYIAKSAEGDYATADGWKEFLNVVTQESSMIENIDVKDVADNILITAVNGEIVIKGANDTQIAVYNVDGSMIYQGANRPVAVENKGVYVVVVNGIAMKVML